MPRNKFRLLQQVIRLYPKTYQNKFGNQLLQTTEDMLDHTESNRQRLIIWLRVWLDLPLSIAIEQSHAIGRQVVHDSPNFVKRNGIISALMLSPFIFIILANNIAIVVFQKPLYTTWLWHQPIINMWVLWLPVLALLLAGTSLLWYLFGDYQKKKVNVSNRLLSPSRYAPVIIPALISLGILGILAFHDSLQCWTHSPVRDLTHLSQTWRCTTNNQSLPVFRKYL